MNKSLVWLPNFGHCSFVENRRARCRFQKAALVKSCRHFRQICLRAAAAEKISNMFAKLCKYCFRQLQKNFEKSFKLFPGIAGSVGWLSSSRLWLLQSRISEYSRDQYHKESNFPNIIFTQRSRRQK